MLGNSVYMMTAETMPGLVMQRIRAKFLFNAARQQSVDGRRSSSPQSTRPTGKVSSKRTHSGRQGESYVLAIEFQDAGYLEHSKSPD